MAKMTVQAEPRSGRGKNEARRLRRAGKVPGVLYGAGQPSIAVSMSPKELRAVLASESARNTILDLRVQDGEAVSAMIADWQHDPLGGALLHLDLKRIAMDRVLIVTVPVTAAGEPPGVKTQGGILEFVQRDIEVECLPGDIPEHVVADVSALLIGTQLRAKDLKLSERVRLVTEPEQPILHVVAPRAVEETVAEPGAVPEAAAAPAEPEVIRKGKAEKEEEE